MDKSFKVSLSVEELATCFMFAGKKDEGKGILKGSTGELNSDEERGRFMAASHSLIARGLLSSENGTARLSAEVNEIVNGMLISPTTVRASKTIPGGEAILAFYASPAGWMEHRITDQIIHYFRLSVQKSEIYDVFEQFFSPVYKSDLNINPILLPYDFFKLDSKERRSFDAILKKIHQTSPNQTGSETLARDMAQAQWRGNLLKLEVAKQKNDLDTQSIFWVQGSDKLWVIYADGNDLQNVKLMAKVENLAGFQLRIKELVA